MKATNHPSDKMTIKNNNGDLLLEIDAEGVEEIKFKNGSKYTGEEIDAAVAKATDLNPVTANFMLGGTESYLYSIKVKDTKYKISNVKYVNTPAMIDYISISTNFQDYKLYFPITSTGAGKTITSIDENSTVLYENGIAIKFQGADRTEYSEWFTMRNRLTIVPTNAEAISLVTTGSSSRVIHDIEDDTAFNPFQVGDTVLLFTDLGWIPLFITQKSSYEIRVRGTVTVKSGESTFFSAAGTYLIKAVLNISSHQLQITCTLDSI